MPGRLLLLGEASHSYVGTAVSAPRPERCLCCGQVVLTRVLSSAERRYCFTLLSLEFVNAILQVNFNCRQMGFVLKLTGPTLQAPQVHRPFPRPCEGP